MAEELSLNSIKEMKKADYIKAWKKAKAVLFLVDYNYVGKKAVIVIMTLFVYLFTSCSTSTPKKEIKMDLSTKSFTEGTVGMIGEHKVMFSNIMIQDYKLEDGTTQEGPAASLSLPNTKEWVVVGAGSTFLLDGKKYEVVEITEDDPFGKIIVKI